MALEVFISHAHKDELLARSLVLFLMNGVGIDRREVRCSSNVATGLSSGAAISDELRRDIKRCRIFLPLVSSNSIQRDFVAFEIGAAWGLKKDVFPVVYGRLHKAQLPSLLTPLLFRDLSRKDHLIKLGEDLAREIFKKTDQPDPAEINAAADDFLSALKKR